MYNDIVKAEAGIIVNRIQHTIEKLLNEEDINNNNLKYNILKKCLEMEKKNFCRDNNNININNENINNENENINEDIPEYILNQIKTNNQLQKILNQKKILYTKLLKNKKFFRVVLSGPEIYDIVCYTLYHYSSWSELPHGLSLGNCWNLYWTYGPPNINYNNIFTFQKINHLINAKTIHRKDLLHKNIMKIRKMNKKLYEIFNIMPQTFLLSKEYMNFVEEFQKCKNDEYNIWIVKPIGRSRGKGIFLTNEIFDVPLNENYLVQKYLYNPLLLDEKYKFDLRIYALVTSVNPLEIFIYKDGFARVSNEIYNMDINNLKTHLTNAAIQNHKALNNNKNYEKIYGGSKISLDMLKYKLFHQYKIDFDNLIWPQIKNIFIKAMISCQNDIPYSMSNFELFGFDIIIDKNYKCWLLEINSSPSLERTNVLDDQIKLPLVDDLLNIINPININRKYLVNMLEKFMKINNKNKENYILNYDKMQFNIDLTNIFYGKMIRKYGEMPKKMGRFEKICPSKESEKLIKMTGGQKLYNGKRKNEKDNYGKLKYGN